jgi:hypothetical protein
MLNDALKNDFGVEAVRYSLLSAAVTTTVGALSGRHGRFGAISSGRADPIGSPPAPPLCFYYCFDPGPPRRGLHRCRSNNPYVICITDAWRKTGQKQAE